MSNKITVIGAGNVGATCADVMASRELAADIVLLDIKEGMAEGKAMDIMQTSSLREFDTRVTGVTGDYQATENSDIVVITSGIPRKPGMTREDLIGTNANIVKSVADSVLKYSPNAIFVIISNPMDTMTYLTLKSCGLPANRVIGMGGTLDSARFKYSLSKALNVPSTEIQAFVIGGHGDTTMIPLIRFATYNGIPVSELLSKELSDKAVADTMVGGATLTKLLGTSAWYAPGAACASLVESVVRDQKKVLPCSVLLNGEYGQKDIAMGVPVVLGKNGCEKIIDYKLNGAEQDLFNKSAEAVRGMNSVLHEMKVI
ncbi:MAG: malate dehydrogenase [Prevotellaceae bacterium]|nr:malate dehydrogenase [Prevotellaceae bacterium]